MNNCWLEHPEFKPFVEKIWAKLNIKGKKAYVIKEKLKRLKEELRGWNREVFGILDLNIENTVKELNEAEGLTSIDGIEVGQGRPFLEEDVREVIWSCDGNKSPGPDGFNFNFLKECWSTLKIDVMEFLNEFHQNDVLPKAVTASFLALIPKKDHPQLLSYYRPICLIDILYKLLSKLLAARLKNIMGKLISSCQSAFLPGRQILDGVVVLNEIIDLAKRRKDCCLFFKVDFERAYDTISWNYLESMMLKMGFAEKWMKWMRACIFNSSMSVLINGSPTEEFTVGKGLRQGDPLSPFLFLLAAEGLSGMVNKAVDIGKFAGFKVNDSIRFQILQFADDTILMNDCSWENVRTMESILRGFELVSGLKINFVKSKLYGINVEANFLAAAATFLDCSFDSIPFKFLGIPVGANPRRLATWKPIVESMAKRLSSWNGCNLSIGVVTGPKDSLWWRDVAGVGGKAGDCWFPSHVSSLLGNGNSISFWKEKWYGTVPLRDLFPREGRYRAAFIRFGAALGYRRQKAMDF
ncbi:LINE-1 reverse transcriptase like [Trifolium medium]|uniref:LINE-1 reverse transcriptase like n=1 Tax=Trifolium medium TaxID=97028 RepID=A0A392M014_9FABA|nr:LINE-1 reverse transcriptase like [Trifolium medium]